MFLVRKIARAKWDSKEFPVEKIQADAITVDLRTRENSLSFWKSPAADDNSINDVALAMAATAAKLDAIDLVWFPYKNLREKLAWEDTLGETPFGEMATQHIDACQLDYEALGEIAHCITAAIKKQQRKRLAPRAIANLLASAVREERIKFDQLSEKVRKSVSDALQKAA